MKPEASRHIGHIARAMRVLAFLPVPFVLLLGVFAVPTSVSEGSGYVAQAAGDAIRFAVVGDFGSDGQPPADVGKLIAGWNPDFVITTGDNNYPDGAASTIDDNIGQYYHSFIFPYQGKHGAGATTNRFFPSLGNHDWDTAGAQPYLDYFNLPGNERYYDFVRGHIHFFVLDSDPREPDGTSANSVQAGWLKSRLASATEPWKVVYFHHPPYSSGLHGATVEMRWPFAEWGASAVLTGHDHDYERISLNGFPYFVNGLGGRSTYPLIIPIPGSVARFSGEYGAMLVDANDFTMTYRFITRFGSVKDTYAACRVWSWHPGQLSCLTPGNGARQR